MRMAAAEAWCLILGVSIEDSELALAPAGQALQEGKLPSKVGGELLRGIARRVRPDRIPGLVAALANTDPEAPRALHPHRAAAEACLLHAVAPRSDSGGAPPDA